MNWNQDKSVKLTQSCIDLFVLLFVGILLLAPKGFTLLLTSQGLSLRKLPWLLATIYLGALPAAGALWDLNRLLHQIRGGQVFVTENVRILRRLSWYCMSAALICLLGGWVYPVFILIGATAAFIGLILRVLKNVFVQAVELKTENDYTI